MSHRLSSANEPPGALGFKRRIAAGDIGDDFFQPVRIIVPQGASVSPADAPTERNGPIQPVFGLQVGRPYRFVISNIPLLEELPLYPSIELIDRTHPPPGMEVRFAVPIEFSTADLRAAAAGNYIERIVYVEDPDLALPVGTRRDSAQRVLTSTMTRIPWRLPTRWDARSPWCDSVRKRRIREVPTTRFCSGRPRCSISMRMPGRALRHNHVNRGSRIVNKLRLRQLLRETLRCD